jgi:hypothetical protein
MNVLIAKVSLIIAVLVLARVRIRQAFHKRLTTVILPPLR